MAKFKKGQSGNISGRPKMSIEFRNFALEKSQELLAVLSGIALNSEERTADRIKAAQTVLGYGAPLNYESQEQLAQLEYKLKCAYFERVKQWQEYENNNFSLLDHEAKKPDPIEF